MPSTLEEAQHMNCEVGTFFQLDIALDYDGHEILWRLVKLPDEVMYQGDGYKDGLVYDNVAEGCLEPGDYEFTIHDSGGDGIQDPGYYSLKLCKGSCQIVAGGNDFGYNETTAFTILADGETAPPAVQPTTYSSAPTNPNASSKDTSEDSSFVDPIDGTESSRDIEQYEFIIRHNHENWVTILDENFESGFGYFIDKDTTAVLYDIFEGRAGVIAIQDAPDSDNSSLVSKTIKLGEAIGDGKIHSKFKVAFSYYALNMESNDGFCFDYSTDGGLSWNNEQCWHKGVDFDNDKWNDDNEVIFEPNVTSSITLRFRCNANSDSDSVMIDNIHLSDLHE